MKATIQVDIPEITCFHCKATNTYRPRSIRRLNVASEDGEEMWSVFEMDAPSGWALSKSNNFQALCPACFNEWQADFLPPGQMPLPEAPAPQPAPPSTGLSANGTGLNRLPPPNPIPANSFVEPIPVKHEPSKISAIPSVPAGTSHTRVSPSVINVAQNRVSPNVQMPTMQQHKSRVDNIIRAEASKVNSIPPPAGQSSPEPKVTGSAIVEKAHRVDPVAPPAGVVKTLDSVS